MTKPHLEEGILVRVRGETTAPKTLDGVRVWVKSGDALAADLIDKPGRPMRVSMISEASGPAAGSGMATGTARV